MAKRSAEAQRERLNDFTTIRTRQMHDVPVSLLGSLRLAGHTKRFRTHRSHCRDKSVLFLFRNLVNDNL